MIKIGTRNSPLALWQARAVEQKLQKLGCETLLVPVSSSGDKNLQQPLYSLGITGVFTKDLDQALLNQEIDIAVHSLKDVPTVLPQHLEISAVLERDFPQDVLVRKSSAKDRELSELKIATSSLRRRAFWLEQFPQTEFFDIRGNVQTRLQKLEEGTFDATIFSLAGLKRMQMNLDYELLDFMISAPSQGVVAVVNREDDAATKKLLQKINHDKTQICVEIERNFLRTLEGGCTAPIGALARFENGKIKFTGKLNSLDGKSTFSLSEELVWEAGKDYGSFFAQHLLEKGGSALMQEIRKSSHLL